MSLQEQYEIKVLRYRTSIILANQAGDIDGAKHYLELLTVALLNLRAIKNSNRQDRVA